MSVRHVSPWEQQRSDAAGSAEYRHFIPLRRFQPSVAISPDGSMVAYSTNTSGQYNLWLQPTDDTRARQLTHFTDNAVRELGWAPGGRCLVFSADHDGDEQFQLYLLDVDSGEITRLTHADGCQHELPIAPFDRTGRYLLYSANDRMPDKQDMIIRDLSNGTCRRIEQPGDIRCEPVGISPDGRWLLATGYRSHTDIGAFILDLTAPDARLREITPEGGIFDPVGWAADSAGFYLKTTYWGGEFTAIGYCALDERTLRPVCRAKWDVEQFATGADDQVHAWTVNYFGRSLLRVRNGDYRFEVEDLPNAVIHSMAISRDGKYLALLIEGATRPAEIALLDLTAPTLRYLTDSRPEGLQATQPIEPIRTSFPSAEGRTISALLYQPQGQGPFPLLMWIHGGPHGQARPTYERNGMFQFLLTQGIGILCPDMSGSTGYGTTFEKRLDRDWGGADLEDFAAALRHLHDIDWVDPAKIALCGGSYGGFAALSCLSRLDHPWAAGVSICGPSNLVTLSTACPPTWRDFVDTILGHPERDAALLTSRSPVTHADQIKAPLFVIQGAMDPRVPQSGSDQIVERLRARGVDVRYDVYPNEGHSFTNRANENKAYGDITEFLLTHLR